jgi:hypothetical protein
MNKIRVGFFSFTEITDAREHRAYNEWHQLDHLPEQFPLDGVAFGQRWVSTPACRAARAVSDASLDPIHYVTLYLMTEPVDRTLREFMALGGDLRALGRFHEHRRSLSSGPFRALETAVAPRVLISAEALPYRPNRGVYIVVEEPALASNEYLHWLHTEHAPALCALEGVAGLWNFATSPTFSDHPWKPGNRRVTVIYLDGDVLPAAARIDVLDAHRRERFAGETSTVFAGPFETITPWQWSWFDA